jgi:hypothetical protein
MRSLRNAWGIAVAAPLIVAAPINAWVAGSGPTGFGRSHHRVAQVVPSVTRTAIGEKVVGGRYIVEASPRRSEGRTNSPPPPTGLDWTLIIATALSALGTGGAIVKRLVRKRNGRSRSSPDGD